MEYRNAEINNGIYEQIPKDASFPVTCHFSETMTGNITQAHWHEHIELLCVRQGTLRIYIHGDVTEASEGDLIVINPGETHAIPEREIHSSYDCLIAHKSLYTKMELPLENHLIENYIQNTIYTETFRQIIQIMRSRPDMYQLDVQLLLLHLILDLMRIYPKNPESLKKSVGSPGQYMVKQAIEYIQEHYTQPISTKDICLHLGFDESYICNLFKKNTGTTIIGYLNVVRCEHARELLQTGRLSISECALLSGFQHFPYFTKTYKRCMGELPSATYKYYNK